MGGVIATQGSARCPERVAALVYVSAFMPRDGQSVLDLTKLPEGADDQVQANLTIAGDPPAAVLSDAASRAALYGCCAEDVAAWAIARQTPQPLAPFGTPASIPPAALAGTKRYFVLCTQDRAIPPADAKLETVENSDNCIERRFGWQVPEFSEWNIGLL